MFSEELEILIDAALADGVITEKERLILHKRAQAEGIDVDELDIIIDSRLVKMSNDSNNRLRETTKEYSNQNSQQPRTDQSLSLKGRRISVADQFDQQLEDLKTKYDNEILNINKYDSGSGKFDKIKDLEKKKKNAYVDLLMNFTVSNEREDIVEFLEMCKKGFTAVEKESKEYYVRQCERIKDGWSLHFWDLENLEDNDDDDDDDDLGKNIKQPGKENRILVEKGINLIRKAKALFPQDPELNAIVEEYEGILNGYKERNEELRKLKEEVDYKKSFKGRMESTMKFFKGLKK